MHERETDELSLHSLGVSMVWRGSRRSSELDYYLFRRAFEIACLIERFRLR